MQGLRRLTHLEISNNLIADLESINVLRRCTPQLATVDFRNNPVCKEKSYRSWIIRQLKCLDVLDGSTLPSEDKEKLQDSMCCIDNEMICASLAHHNAQSMFQNGLPNQFLLVAQVESCDGVLILVYMVGAQGKHGDSGSQCFFEAGSMQTMDELILKHKHIQRISNLGKLTGLRKLCLSDNEITKVEGLESCEALSELNLEVSPTHGAFPHSSTSLIQQKVLHPWRA